MERFGLPIWVCVLCHGDRVTCKTCPLAKVVRPLLQHASGNDLCRSAAHVKVGLFWRTSIIWMKSFFPQDLFHLAPRGNQRHFGTDVECKPFGGFRHFGSGSDTHMARFWRLVETIHILRGVVVVVFSIGGGGLTKRIHGRFF